MTDLPVWLQEIRDRAEAATKGPWVSATRDGPFGTQSDVRTTEGWPNVIASRTIVGAAKPIEQQESNFAFIAHARMDVPRLIDAVAEITDALEAAITEVQRRCPRLCDCGGKYMPSGISDNDVCAKCRSVECRIPGAIAVYRKYRREVEDDD